ncbi:hypothetical protein H5410_021149 [Solanum commersonii]|uniref:Gnk2-homologous domain-containing protein n=1 Tax=Solanum commersonii TaxID=4109 RepID=A0A9J5ZEB9_SOLCO|nr:hypothetical protein H5410_021149 [Solanum commersonii]
MAHLQIVCYVLIELSNETPKQGYDYYITSPYPNDALAYGHATCSSNVEYSDCDTCVRLARGHLMTTCDGSIGGQVKFIDCSMSHCFSVAITVLWSLISLI